MTTDIAAADRSMPYKQVVRLMTDRRVNAVPVVDSGHRVLGMVSEADVLRKQERNPRRLDPVRRSRGERKRAEARTAGELMTSPAITIDPDAPLSAAARLMNARHLRRLPVVDGSGTLIGVVSRRDLMKVFLRPDTEIEAEVRDVLTGILLEGAGGITVAVHEGEVILTGVVTDKDMIPVAARLASGVPAWWRLPATWAVRPAPSRKTRDNPRPAILGMRACCPGGSPGLTVPRGPATGRPSPGRGCRQPSACGLPGGSCRHATHDIP
jgi:CBS domain-containing protein